MPHPRIADEVIAADYNAMGPAVTARKHGMDLRVLHARLKTMRTKGYDLHSPIGPGAVKREVAGRGPHRLEWKVENGSILIGSDAHYWPGPPTVAHRAFVKFCRELDPAGVIMNGDAFDGASISRWPLNWEERPTVKQELEAVSERLGEIEQATKRRTPMAFPWGNHDQRFENRLAQQAPEFAGVTGVHLKDHVNPRWQPCQSVWINDAVVVKHRGRGGDHAPWNNTMRSGMSYVTGHLHSAKVTPFDDHRGTRYGVDCGCLADPYGPQFSYTEDGFRNHRSGFCVLTFVGGELLMPELVLKWDDKHIQFRGKLIRV